MEKNVKILIHLVNKYKLVLYSLTRIDIVEVHGKSHHTDELALDRDNNLETLCLFSPYKLPLHFSIKIFILTFKHHVIRIKG